MKFYRDVVFLQGDDYLTLEDKVDEMAAVPTERRAWSDLVLEYLMQWENGDGGDESPRESWGTSDQTFRKEVGDSVYVISVNESIGYAGLTEVIERNK